MDPASASSVAARARTENFPVASLLFPRSMRPHLRAVYGFARLVDILGDEVEGDRLAALDELEPEVDACYEGEPTWAVMRALQPTIQACGLPREPFLRLIEANRMDQRVSEYETWADLKHYCVHSADPVGRLVLGVIGRGRARAGGPLRRRLHRACSSSTSSRTCRATSTLGRVYLPAEDRRRFGVTELGRAERAAASAAGVRGRARARAALRPGEQLGRRARRPRRPRGRALRARRARGAGGARARRLGHLHGRPRPSRPGSPARPWRLLVAMTRRGGLRGGRAAHAPRARNFAYGIMVLPRPKRQAIAAIYAFARRVDDVADGELPRAEKRARLEGCTAPRTRRPARTRCSVALADARSRYPIPARCAARRS